MRTYIYGLRSFHSFFIATALILCGISAAHTHQIMFYLLACCLGLVACSLQPRASYPKVAIGSFVLFALAYGHYSWHASSFYTRTTMLKNNTPQQLYATVVDLKKAEHQHYKAIITLKVHHWQTKDAADADSRSWTLQCYCATEPSCMIDDEIMLKEISITVASNNDFGLFLLKENIHATSFIKKEQCRIIKRPAYSLKRELHSFRQRILERLRTKCSPVTFAFIALIFFGEKYQSKYKHAETKELFNGWGIMHFLARSGLHLVIFIMALNYCFGFIPLRLLYKQLLLVVLCLLYYLLSWPSISFIRALTTFLWYTTYNIYYLQVDRPRIILLITLACLAYNPIILFFLDFQLSFGLTFILAITTQYTIAEKRAF